MILVGKAPKGCKGNTMVCLIRVPGQRWHHLICFGQKSHYRKADGGCAHTDEVLESVKPEAQHLVKVQPFGAGRRAPNGEKAA